MASVQNIVIDQGSDFTYLFELTGSSQMDFSGASAHAAMKKEYFTNDTPVAFSTSMTGSNVTIGLTGGVTSGLDPGSWVYDVYVTNGVNAVIRVVQGRVTVTPQVTPLP